MLKQLFSPSPLWQNAGLVLIRILTGAMMAYHGWEVFNAATMQEYLKWDVIKSLPSPEFMMYFAKGMELATGICLAIGLFTRLAALFMAIIMFFICFKIGNGKFYYEDQHPFLFGTLALVYFFTGPVKWSIDQLLFKN